MPVHLVASLFVGCDIGLAAKGREMVVTGTLGLVLCAMAVAGLLVVAAKTGDVRFSGFCPGLSLIHSASLLAGQYSEGVDRLR
jgi:hypothetical protein